MTYPGGIWESRYRYLESQIEVMLINFADVLEEKEKSQPPSTNGNEPPFEPNIRKLFQTTYNDTEVVYCVGDAINPEFSFVFSSNDKVLKETPFGRLNLAGIPHHKSTSSLSCTVRMKSDVRGKRVLVERSIQVNK